MVKYYKGKSPHIKKLSLMLLTQVSFGIIPVLLLIIYLFRIGDENYAMGFIFIALMLAMLTLYIFISQQYKILLSGYKGERELKKLFKKMKFQEECAIFINLPIRYKRNLSEIDLLFVSQNGILIVEVKNHSGTITGSDYDDYWLQEKNYKNGKHVEIQMDNPFRQIKRQREILKSILRAENQEMWVDNVLFFSNPKHTLRLQLHQNNYAFGNPNELVEYVNGYKSKKSVSHTDFLKIVDILKNHEI